MSRVGITINSVAQKMKFVECRVQSAGPKRDSGNEKICTKAWIVESAKPSKRPD